LSAIELLRTESTFERCVDFRCTVYVDIAGCSFAMDDLVSCVLYTMAVACLPLR